MNVPTVHAGRRLGPYQIVDEIGRGGMAVVYKAYDLRRRRTVALKVLPTYFQHDRQLVERFHREARAARDLRHPNIVQVYESGEADGQQFLAMEYAGGGSLAGLLARQQRPLDLQRSVEIAIQVAAALEYAHGRGLIHRDLKPSNILIAADGRVLLCDFGIAKVLGQSTLTGTGQVMGTPAYMAPEQARGLRDLDTRADIYALGVILYQILTGQVPFEGDTPIVVLRAVIDDPPSRPTALNRSIPPGIEGVILRAMEKERGRRFQRAGEMAAALQAVIYHMGPQRRAAEPPTIREGPVPPVASTPRPERRVERTRLPSWLLPVAAGILALVLVLIVFAAFYQPGPPATPTQVALPATGIPGTPTPQPGGLLLPSQPTPTLELTGEGAPSPTIAATEIFMPSVPPSPSLSATVTARPSATFTPKPTATPSLYPAPVLDAPPDNASIVAPYIKLEWHWIRTLDLGADEHFDVRMWLEGKEGDRGIAWADEESYEIDLAGFQPGRYTWYIVVIRGHEGQMERELSARSGQRSFIWEGVQPTEPPPKDTPEPPPTDTPEPPPTSTPTPGKPL